MELFSSVKLRSGYVDEKMSAEHGKWVRFQFWVNHHFKSTDLLLINGTITDKSGAAGSDEIVTFSFVFW